MIMGSGIFAGAQKKAGCSSKGFRNGRGASGNVPFPEIKPFYKPNQDHNAMMKFKSNRISTSQTPLIILGVILTFLLCVFTLFYAASQKSKMQNGFITLNRQMEDLKAQSRQADTLKNAIRELETKQEKALQSIRSMARFQQSLSLKTNQLEKTVQNLQQEMASLKPGVPSEKPEAKEKKNNKTEPKPEAGAGQNTGDSQEQPEAGKEKPSEKKKVTVKKALKKPESGTQYHHVTKGDTLFSISRQYKISVSEIRRLNNLSTGDSIHPGQRLIIRP